MAAKSNKNIVDINSKIQTTLEKIDLSKVEFGNVFMNEDTKEFEVSNENEVNDLINTLQKFIDDLERNKEDYKNSKINEIILDQVKNGGESAQALAKIFNQ
ncbi:hypothetical protein [Staphylococcus gallinarum]|uniref:hypothetical protein n=1 Tax=Staphylococcus gallinarum TaxID=1293 RepID=UPI001E5EECB3|nr:hypothetical protein [Staphylococcus gallinarum]MCD8845149.1 hypothetical protein [Staphylococcus gallinarum]